MAIKLQKNVEKIKGKYSTSEIVVYLLIPVVVVAAIVTAILLLTGKNDEIKPEPVAPPKETVYFEYGAHTLAAFPDIETSPYNTAFFNDEDGRLTYNEKGVKSYFGIDVSGHQETIDWTAVKNAGVDFAFIRIGNRGATEGALYPDSYFEDNVKGAYDAGINVGVYFFSQAITVEEAKEEANMVLKLLKPFKDKISYPVVFDWEHHEPAYRTENLSSEILTSCCVTFCDMIKDAGYTPMVYFNLELAYMEYDLSKISQYDFWLAQYDSIPSFYYDYGIVQYTRYGTKIGRAHV